MMGMRKVRIELYLQAAFIVSDVQINEFKGNVTVWKSVCQLDVLFTIYCLNFNILKLKCAFNWFSLFNILLKSSVSLIILPLGGDGSI